MSAFNLDSIKAALNLGESHNELDSFDLLGVSKLIKEGKVKNIVTMVGAGISTPAGIPDFRSPSTGIYDNLDEYDLPDPMAVFSIDFFRHDPRPFFEVARRLYKPEAKPTLAHYFVRLLDEKNLLRRHYTQNVDDLERISGLKEDKFIEAHGTFHTGHCILCGKEYSFEFMKERIMKKTVPKCSSDRCEGVVKPDVVFFGENLPKRFYSHISKDFSACDLLIIMGTSLTVMPFCGLIHRVGSKVPRLYINREYRGGDTGSGFFSFIMRFMVAGFKKSDLRWGESDNKRDIFVKADADDAVIQLAELLGWKDELLALKKEHDGILDKNLSEPDSRKASESSSSSKQSMQNQ